MLLVALGLAIAARLREGYRVIATGRKETTEINQLCTHREADMGEVFFCPFDLSGADLIRRFVRSVTGQYGPLYGLVNNAALGLDGVLATMHDSQIAQLIEVNVLSAIFNDKICITLNVDARLWAHCQYFFHHQFYWF